MAQGIYKIINVVNNKFYVGSTVNVSRRRARHFSELRNNKHNNKYLQAAWNKYGEKAFIFIVVEEVESKDKLLTVENFWLKEHVGKEYCYNLGTDATAPHLGMFGELSNTWGYKHTEEAKARISKASKERVQTEEEKSKRRKSMQGHIVSKATKDKISATLSGEGNYWYGKKRPEHGAKLAKEVHEITTDTYYPSIAVVREHFGFKPTTINRALKSNKPISRGPHKGLHFEYIESSAQNQKRMAKHLAQT